MLKRSDGLRSAVLRRLGVLGPRSSLVDPLSSSVRGQPSSVCGHPSTVGHRRSTVLTRMSNLAIRPENLGELYRIGPRQRYRTLPDTLTDGIYAPFRALTTAVHRRGPLLHSLTAVCRLLSGVVITSSGPQRASPSRSSAVRWSASSAEAGPSSEVRPPCTQRSPSSCRN